MGQISLCDLSKPNLYLTNEKYICWANAAAASYQMCILEYSIFVGQIKITLFFENFTKFVFADLFL